MDDSGEEGEVEIVCCIYKNAKDRGFSDNEL